MDWRRIVRRLVGPAASIAAAAAVAAPPLGERAPEFTLRLLTGERVESRMLAGRVVVLNYWATWCAPCRIELADLAAYAARHPQLAIYAVNVDAPTRAWRVAELAATLRLPVATIELGAARYGPIGSAVPSTYAIDRAGTLRFARSGALKSGEIEAVLESLLAAGPR